MNSTTRRPETRTRSQRLSPDVSVAPERRKTTAALKSPRKVEKRDPLAETTVVAEESASTKVADPKEVLKVSRGLRLRAASLPWSIKR
jgi:hypothetical protein